MMLNLVASIISLRRFFAPNHAIQITVILQSHESWFRLFTSIGPRILFPIHRLFRFFDFALFFLLLFLGLIFSRWITIGSFRTRCIGRRPTLRQKAYSRQYNKEKGKERYNFQVLHTCISKTIQTRTGAYRLL